MKLLYLPLLYEGTNNEQKYLEAEFRKHYEVEVFDFMNTPNTTPAFLTKVQQFKPDIIHCQFQQTNKIDPLALNNLKSLYPNTVISQWVGDVRPEPCEFYMEYAKYCDLNMVVSTTDVDTYTKLGVKNVRYWQNAVARKQLGKADSDPQNIIFCGGRYTVFPNSSERIELIERFLREFPGKMNVYGFGWSDPKNLLPWDSQTENYSKHYLILGHNNVPGKRWWFSDRQLIAMASGRPHLCQYSEDLELLFDDMKDCVFYRSIDEAVEKAKWLLAHPKEAAKIGYNGRKRIYREHLWKHRVAEYQEFINEARSQRNL
jgi:hypothetical protein